MLQKSAHTGSLLTCSQGLLLGCQVGQEVGGVLLTFQASTLENL